MQDKGRSGHPRNHIQYFEIKKMAGRPEQKMLRRQSSILAAKNFLAQIDNGAMPEDLGFIANAAGDLALFWHLIGNPEEIPLLELQR